MRRLFLVVAHILVIFNTASAQNALSLNDAISLLLNNNAELQIETSRSIILKKQSEYAGILPDPSIEYSREDLSANTSDYDEWSLTGSIPINFLWERWSKIEEGKYMFESGRQLLLYKKNLLISDLIRQYNTYDVINHQSSKLKEIVSTLEKVLKNTEMRYSEGDISAYEKNRIAIEIQKINSKLFESLNKQNTIKNHITILTGIEAEYNLATDQYIPTEENIPSQSELIKEALNHRPDIISYDNLLKSKKSSLSNNKISMLPDITLSAGYKKQTDGFEGSIIAVEFALPLFNRNQLNIEKSKLEISISERQKHLRVLEIKNDINTNYSIVKNNFKLLNQINVAQLETILENSLLSYSEGEINVVEFIDGIRSYVDGISLLAEIKINLAYAESKILLLKSDNLEKYYAK